MFIHPDLLDDKTELDEFPIQFDDYEKEVAFKNQLMEWKAYYGSVYMIEINDVIFVFRALTKGELDLSVDSYKDDYERTEVICKTCVLDPIIEDYSIDMYGGIPEALCRAILKESGFSNDSTDLKLMIARWERKLEQPENQMPLLIKEAFQDIPLLEIESWTIEKQIEYYVKGKWLLENLRGLTLVSGNEGEG